MCMPQGRCNERLCRRKWRVEVDDHENDGEGGHEWLNDG